MTWSPDRCLVFLCWPRHPTVFLLVTVTRSGDTSGVGSVKFETSDGIEAKRVETSASFFLSIEFQETGGYALRIQRTAFGRHSNDPFTRYPYLFFMRDSRTIAQGVVIGQPGADALLEQNKQNYAEQTVLSNEFTIRFPLVPAAAYVDALFASAGVTPSAAERTAAISAFGAGGTTGRIAALRSVTDSA